MGRLAFPIEPWEGKNYGNGIFGNLKIMILGESFYWDDLESYIKDGYSQADREEDINAATICTIEKYLNRLKLNDEEKKNRRSWKSTYTKLTKICLDKNEITQADKECFWDSILFYNYIVEPLDKPRANVSQNLWAKSEILFFNVLKYFQPNCILILGDRLWDNMAKKGWSDYNNKNFGYYLIDGKKIYASSIYHPASFYPYGTEKYDSRRIFKELLFVAENNEADKMKGNDADTEDVV